MWSRYYEEYSEDYLEGEELEEFLKALREREETEAIFALSDETELYATI